MRDIFGEVPTRILIASKLWNIPDREERKKAILAYLKTSYPGYSVVGVDKPFVLCRKKEGR